jgi:hypothetical protein
MVHSKSDAKPVEIESIYGGNQEWLLKKPLALSLQGMRCNGYKPVFVAKS